jgi:tetratricopeptide (TPR) repeat protein
MAIGDPMADRLVTNWNLWVAIGAVAAALAGLAQAVEAPVAVTIVLSSVAVAAALAALWFYVAEGRLRQLDAGVVIPPQVVPRADLNKPMKFDNRQEELAKLDKVLDRAEQGLGPLVAVLDGLPGVGKSAVGRYWADRVRTRFTDGDLVADFSKRRRGPAVDIDGFLAEFIRKLGPPGTIVPTNTEDLVDRFKQITFDRRLLILLDDVSDTAQVLNLRPGGKHCLVIATCYGVQAGLVHSGAEVVPVKPLKDDRAVSLLVKMAGDFGYLFTEHPEDTRQLVEYCGGLALPLCVCAERLLLGEGNRTVASVVSDVADEQRRLDYLSGTGEYAGAAVFGFAYADLLEHERLVYRRIALHPGVDLSPVHAAVLAQLSMSQARDLLMDLADTHLLEPRADGRYQFHNLVRLHARERVVDEEAEEVREQSLSALVAWYRASLRRADRAIVARRLRLAPVEPIEARYLPTFTSREESLDWLEAERANLLAVLRAARDREWDDSVWQMVESLWLFHYNRRHYADWIDATKMGVECARRAGHADAETRMRTQLAWAYVELGNFEDAHDELDRANQSVLLSANRQLQGSVREFSGSCHLMEGDYELALAAYAEARAIFVELHEDRAVALQDYFIGCAYLRQDEFDGALRALRLSFDTMRAEGDETFIGRALLRIGQATLPSGDVEGAEAALKAGLEIFRRLRMPVEEAETYEQLAAVADARHDGDAAAEHRERANAIFLALGHPGAGGLLAVEPGSATR